MKHHVFLSNPKVIFHVFPCCCFFVLAYSHCHDLSHYCVKIQYNSAF